jgi:hypothetical protein
MLGCLFIRFEFRTECQECQECSCLLAVDIVDTSVPAPTRLRRVRNLAISYFLLVCKVECTFR